MDDNVIIDCIGPSVLVITIRGATHSVPIATDVIRIGGPSGASEHSLHSLPLIYDAAVLGGRLNVCDGEGKMVYCWRSLTMPQSSRSSASVQGGNGSERYLSDLTGPGSKTGMVTPDSSLDAVASGPRGTRRSVSIVTDGASSVLSVSPTITLTPGCKLSNDVENSRHSTSDDVLEVPSNEPEGPVKEDLVLKLDRHLQELRRKQQWAELRERTCCQNCRDEPQDPVVANCLHVFCHDCAMAMRDEAAEQDLGDVPCPGCNEAMTDTQSCKGMKELWRDISWAVGGHAGRKTGRKTGQGYMDLEDGYTDPSVSGFTPAQKLFLIDSLNELSKLGYSDIFQQPAKYISPTSKRIDLRMMWSKLQDGLYSSVGAIKADFDRMELSAATENGPHHRSTEDARELKVAFERSMTEYPAGDEDVPVRKKAKIKEPTTPLTQIATRGPTSSPPRAAKTAMQGRKYPRDHW